MTTHPIRRGVLAAVAFSAVVACAGSLAAQSGQADVQGIVSDASGAGIPGAQVVLSNISSGDKRTVTTSSDGRYNFPTVAPGHYVIRVSAAAFSAEVINGLTLQLDDHLNENVHLRVGASSEIVEVSAEVPAVDTSTYNVGGVINQSQIDSLPIQNRQYLNLATLIPGTTQDASRTFYSNVQAGGGEYFYATGFYLDGVTNQQTEEGDPRQNIPEGAIDQFKVYTGSMPAELGWAMGGFTTIVTKSGTNKIHGEGFEYYRGQFLNADNQFTRASERATQTGSPLYSRNQYGVDLGGPILKDRTHYYGAFERTQQTTSYTLSAPAQYYSAATGTFPIPGHDMLLTLRLDHDLAKDQQVFARYAQEWNLVSGNGCGGSTTIGCYDGQIPRHAIVVGHTWEPTAKIVNESRFQYAYISYELGPYGTPVPTKPLDLLSPSYTKNVGIGYSFPSFGYGHTYAAVGVESRWEVNDSITIQRGTHSFKAGFDTSYVPYVDASASNLNGTYTFFSDQVFNPNNTSNLTGARLFTQSAVPLIYYLPSTQLSFYGEDSWKLRPNLTINYGLRWDRQYGSPFLDTFTPNAAKPAIPYQGDPHTRGDRNNFGPRVGVSYDPFNHSKDVIRAGYGVYYNFIQTELSEAEKLNFTNCSINIVGTTAAPVPYPNPYGNQSVGSFCSTAPANVTILSPGFSNPYQHQFTAGYSRQLGRSLSASADGIYTHGLRDYKVYDRNYPLNYPVSSVRPDTQIAQDNQHASTATTKYKGLYLKLEKRYDHRYMYTLSYALSSGQDNNPHAVPVNYATPQNDFGPAGIDRRHAIVASGSVMLPLKIMLGGIFTFRSSEPFSLTTATTTPTVLTSAMLNANGTAQYVPGTTRNQGNRSLNFAAVNAYGTDYNYGNSCAYAPNASKAGCVGGSATGYVTNFTPVATNFGSNSFVSTQYKDLDLRVSKYVFQRDTMKLEIIGQAFNLFGWENYTGITTSAVSNTLGQPTAAGNVQIGELAAKFTF